MWFLGKRLKAWRRALSADLLLSTQITSTGFPLCRIRSLSLSARGSLGIRRSPMPTVLTLCCLPSTRLVRVPRLRSHSSTAGLRGLNKII